LAIDSVLAIGKSSRMSGTTDFISELVRAANKVGKLTPAERVKLMVRGARTIREMRLMTGIRSDTRRDALNDVEIAALKSEKGSHEDAQNVLLEMADMIRTLKIVLDAKNEELWGEVRTEGCEI
jgi:hypothetical protein